MNSESMVGFGAKQAWLAVRDGVPEDVRAALRLRDLGPVAWQAGVDLAYLTDDRVVLTPLLEGAGGSRWMASRSSSALKLDHSGGSSGAGAGTSSPSMLTSLKRACFRQRSM